MTNHHPHCGCSVCTAPLKESRNSSVCIEDHDRLLTAAKAFLDAVDNSPGITTRSFGFFRHALESAIVKAGDG